MTTEEKEEMKAEIDEAFDDDSQGSLSKLRIHLKTLVDYIPAETGPAVEGAFIKQGHFDPSDGDFPTTVNCIDPDGGIKKGFAWEITADFNLRGLELSIGDFLVAQYDNAGLDEYSDWDVLQGGIDENALVTETALEERLGSCIEFSGTVVKPGGDPVMTIFQAFPGIELVITYIEVGIFLITGPENWHDNTMWMCHTNDGLYFSDMSKVSVTEMRITITLASNASYADGVMSKFRIIKKLV